ncbi:MAG TPA: VTT domain-containing protein [Pyrinomonadaceae bacterium]|nr:VTT domain-containing protein [Pyrinomonadaceae bacterium]
MKVFSKIAHGLTKVSNFLITLGPFGLFAVALLDSAFLPLPTGADALMIFLTIQKPQWMILYALLATTGSAIGCVILYYISRRAGSRALNKFSPEKQQRVKDWIDRYDMLSMLVASLMPPPFPFKLFVITAGVFRFSVLRFTIAILVGRSFRFLLEGYFASRYGEQAKQLAGWIGLGFAILIMIVFVARHFLKKKSESGTAPSRV